MKNTSETLKREAEELLKMWDLLGYLSKFGEPYVVGSVAMNLMVWRDIDLSVIANSPNKNHIIEIANHLFNLYGMRKITIVDETNTHNPIKPKGFYIGAQYLDKQENIWKLDIWLVTKEEEIARQKTKELLSKINDESRNKILSIKSEIYNNSNYRKNVTSVDIYEAVLEKGINNLEEFKSYIKDTKNILL